MIDLHLHSLCSDGELFPSEVVKKAKRTGVSVLSLTDHDSIAGLGEAMETAISMGMTFIPGVELEAATEINKSRYIHILAYNFKNYVLLERYLSALKIERISLIIQYLDILNQLGYKTSFDEISSLTPGQHLTVYHIPILLSKKGYLDFKTAKRLFINPDSKYYIPRHFYDINFIINLILECGGIPVLAHPCKLLQKGKDLDEYISILSRKGLQGIESYHSAHSKSDIAFYESLAKKYHLIQTAGSDWHSPNEKIEMGISLHNENEIILEFLTHSHKTGN